MQLIYRNYIAINLSDVANDQEENYKSLASSPGL